MQHFPPQGWGKLPNYFIGGLKKEGMMRRKKAFAAVFLLSLFLLSCATTHQVTTEVIPDSARIVRLYVPACTWAGTEAQIREILMNIDGVYDVKGNTLSQYVTVSFDPEKTNVEAFIKTLESEEFFVKGAPVFMK